MTSSGIDPGTFRLVAQSPPLNEKFSGTLKREFSLTAKIYQATQKSVKRFINYTKIRYQCHYLLNLQKLFEIGSSNLNSQLTTLWYRSTNRLAGLNLNILVNTRECFKLTDFWAALYNEEAHAPLWLVVRCAYRRAPAEKNTIVKMHVYSI
jgi:hypothetical protein